MKDKKPLPRWIKAILAMLIAGLLYAVYFTELGRIESSESDKNITIYGQTAAPTLFVQWQQVPTVELDWAYANRDLLKFALKIRGLETNMDPADWICSPYITMDKPVERRPSGHEISSVHDASGQAIQIIYAYEINAGDFDSLGIDLDLTIGPCADYWNFQGPNVTPEVIPELVGNYHLSFRVPVKTGSPWPSLSATPGITAMTTWANIPIFPGAMEVEDDLPRGITTALKKLTLRL